MTKLKPILAVLLMVAACNQNSNITSVVVSPDKATLNSGGSQPFLASIEGSGVFNPALVWTIVSGGGKLSTTTGNGNDYTAPTVTVPTTVTVRATSVADPSKSATAILTVNPLPPASGQLEVLIQGLTGVAADVKVTGLSFNQGLTASQTLSVSPGSYTVTASKVAEGGQNYSPTVPVLTATVVANSKTTVTINYQPDPVPPGVSVSLSPASVNLSTGQAQTFTATVQNASDTSVTWSSSGGSLSPSGNTATFSSNAPGSYTVTATSVQDM